MKHRSTYDFAPALSVLVLASALAACGGGLKLTRVQAAHRKPSNVAVFFTVDTAQGEPVPGLQASDFRIYEDGELVSASESQQTIVSQEVAAEHFTLLLVDMSGSVTESDQVPLIVDAATQFTTSLEGYQRVGVYAFDGSEDLYPVRPFTRSGGGAQGAIAQLGNFKSRDPSTNLHGAVVRGIEELKTAFQSSKAPLRFGTIVVFTDGTDRAARVKREDMIEAVDEAGFDIFAIGVGNEIDEGTLSAIGDSGYVRVQDSNAIAKAFEDIGKRIMGYTQRFYLLSYCSPARAGEHEVTIEAVKDDASGELTYKFDASGFGPQCNPATPPPFPVTGASAEETRGAPRRMRVRSKAEASVSSSDPESGDY